MPKSGSKPKAKAPASSSKKAIAADLEDDESVEEVVEVESDEDIAKSDSEDSDIEDCMDDEDDDDEAEPETVDDNVREEKIVVKRSTRSKADEDVEDKTDKISNLIQKIFFAHKSIGEIGWGHVETVQLIHPRTKSPALFLVQIKDQSARESKDSADSFFIYEVLTMSQETRSWFVGDNVISDGNIYTFTPMDPLFLMAFAMSKSTQARPLLDHLEEVFLRKMAKILCQRVSRKQLENISSRKAVADIEAYVFSESNTLLWLSEKMKKIAAFLRKKEITSSESSVSINFTKAVDLDSSESTEHLRYAGDILSEYVDESLQAKLFAKFGLPMIRPKRKVSDENGIDSKKLKSVDNVQPLEDYGSASKPAAQGSQKVGREKAKAAQFEKAAKGTRLLSSFFQVKPKS